MFSWLGRMKEDGGGWWGLLIFLAIIFNVETVCENYAVYSFLTIYYVVVPYVSLVLHSSFSILPRCPPSSSPILLYRPPSPSLISLRSSLTWWGF